MHRILLIGALASVVVGLAAAGTLNSDTEQALVRALEDERAAAALYDAVIAEQGQVRPFTNIVSAELRHADHLLALFERYAIEVPADGWTQKEIDVPETRAAACNAAIEAEIANIAMYDALLESVVEPDVREMFTILRDASRDRHIPAFERCASAGSGGGPGRGYGAGRGGCGRGQGAGRGGPGPRSGGCCPACCGGSSSAGGS